MTKVIVNPNTSTHVAQMWRYKIIIRRRVRWGTKVVWAVFPLKFWGKNQVMRVETDMREQRERRIQNKKYIHIKYLYLYLLISFECIVGFAHLHIIISVLQA